MNSIRFILGVVGWIMASVAAHADWKADFRNALASVETGRFPADVIDQPSDAAEIAAAEMQSQTTEPAESVPAIFGLWLREDHRSFTELVWWRKRDSDRVGRAFVVALYLSAQVEPTSFQPSFNLHAERFSDPERKQREEEIAFVLAHRSAIAAGLANGLEKSSAAKASQVQKLVRMYRDTAARRLGDPLR